MDKQTRKIVGLFSRYLTILVLGLGNLYIFYKILTPLTIRITHAILSIFTHTFIYNNVIYLKDVGVEIIPACVAGSAFYLLLLLIFSTAEIKPAIRAKALITALVAFFILNILRILLLIPLINTNSFGTIHWIFWHLLSTIFVVTVWFAVVEIYKIKPIPIYSDIKYIKSLIKPIKKSKRNKKNN